MTIHMVKLCVGAETVDDLRHWQERQIGFRPKEGRPARPACQTRMTPKQVDELLDGGSLFWVIKGMILVRNPILNVETLKDREGRAYCDIDLDPELVLTTPTPRKAFQGWRYLKADDAPANLGTQVASAVPGHLAKELREAGVW